MSFWFLVFSWERLKHLNNYSVSALVNGMKRSLIREESYSFALNIIWLYRCLVSRNEFVISKQVLKSGTSIGANVEEALAGQSRADFLSKMSIASKEARETNYWLRLLRDSGLSLEGEVLEILTESERILKMLTAIVKTTTLGNESKNQKLKTKN